METPLPFETGLCFNCDNCGKPGIVMSSAGILYCKHCHYSYGERIHTLEETKQKKVN